MRMRRVTWHKVGPKGVTNNHIFGIPDRILPIHFATFRGAAVIIKGSLLMSLPIIERLGWKFSVHKIVFWGGFTWGKILVLKLEPPK